MANISELSIKRPVLSTVMMLILLLFGMIGYKFLGVREFPSVDNPIDVAIHRANCLNICPVIPDIKDTGTNTAINTSDVAITAPNTSSIVTSVASLGDLPS